MKRISQHRLGSSDDIIIYHPNSKFYFIPIPKNASTTIYQNFSQIGWDYYKLYYHDQMKDKIPIIIYRDPIDRWFSGFAQDYNPENFPDGIQHKNISKEFFKKGFFGLHTLPQSWYIKKYKIYHGVFIKFTKSFFDAVHILKDNIDGADKIVTRTSHGSVKVDGVEDIIKSHYYSNPINQENLKSYLREDLEFYSTINFIDPAKTLQNYRLWDSYKRIESI